MIHTIILIVIYIFICYLIAFLGRNKKFGFWGYLFLSIALTPIVGFIAFLAAENKK